MRWHGRGTWTLLFLRPDRVEPTNVDRSMRLCLSLGGRHRPTSRTADKLTTIVRTEVDRVLDGPPWWKWPQSNYAWSLDVNLMDYVLKFADAPRPVPNSTLRIKLQLFVWKRDLKKCHMVLRESRIVTLCGVVAEICDISYRGNVDWQYRKHEMCVMHWLIWLHLQFTILQFPLGHLSSLNSSPQAVDGWNNWITVRWMLIARWMYEYRLELGR